MFSLQVQAVMIGQSVAGILSSLLSIACQTLTANALVNGRIFFTIAFVWTILSIFLYELMIRSEEIESYSQISQLSDQPLLGTFSLNFQSNVKIKYG